MLSYRLQNRPCAGGRGDHRDSGTFTTNVVLRPDYDGTKPSFQFQLK
jgi:hypothetical protein